MMEMSLAGCIDVEKQQKWKHGLTKQQYENARYSFAWHDDGPGITSTQFLQDGQLEEGWWHQGQDCGPPMGDDTERQKEATQTQGWAIRLAPSARRRSRCFRG